MLIRPDIINFNNPCLLIKGKWVHFQALCSIKAIFSVIKSDIYGVIDAVFNLKSIKINFFKK